MFPVKHDSIGIMFYKKSPFLRKGQARLRAGDRPTKKSCETSRYRRAPTSLWALFIYIASASYPPAPFQRKRVFAIAFSARSMFPVKHGSIRFSFGELYRKEILLYVTIGIRAIRGSSPPSLRTTHFALRTRKHPAEIPLFPITHPCPVDFFLFPCRCAVVGIGFFFHFILPHAGRHQFAFLAGGVTHGFRHGLYC